MTVASPRTGGTPFGLAAGDLERLERRLAEGVRRARRGRGAVLVAITVGVSPDADPTAVVAASREAGDPWWAFEQPDREGSALGALGCAVALDAHGAQRFASVSARWRALVGRGLFDPPEGPFGGGPVAVGGFAFAADGGGSLPWTGFPAASLHVPEVALARRGDEVRLTAAVLAGPDDLPDQLLAGVQHRLAGLRAAPLPLLDPHPAAKVRVASAMPPEHYEAAVAHAVQRIRAGGLEKVVLAREVTVHAGAAHDPAAVLGVLREAFPACHVLCAGRGDAAFVAASPELLVRRDGLRATSLALAGSAARSADPAVDDHLGERLLRSEKDREEHAIVARRIERALAAHAVWVTSAPEPVIAKIANIQHLATPVRAQLARPIAAVELAGALHPTPAVGGEPDQVAGPLIPALEGMDRGWYAGPVGWTDANEDGEFCVALRSALLQGSVARCFAGVGVVRDSDPAAELAETEIKLQALLPVLAA